MSRLHAAPGGGWQRQGADIHVVNALSQNFFVKNVVGKHIFVVFMPLCVTSMKYSVQRNRHALLLFHCFKSI
ncbi:hypothetical protein [Komagataeibacter nataicola]|uniref:hypothetical protein n=1 Tax=Komagataeibacter nataicola TaxID=265960 RepID=UPI00197BB295|nr:hypothetical protein [Komagataeibacter nataicola]